LYLVRVLKVPCCLARGWIVTVTGDEKERRKQQKMSKTNGLRLLKIFLCLLNEILCNTNNKKILIS
jgi:hypothetical protein